MNPATNENTQASNKYLLSMILKKRSHLCDLHTHLLGMGNAGFWIDTILMDELIMPTNLTFKLDEITREKLCPLVWDKESCGFVKSEETARFFYHLVNENIFRQVNGEPNKIVDFKKAIESLSEFSPTSTGLLREKLYNDLIHGGLEFKHDFSYDVVLELSDLAKGLGIKNSDCEGFVQMAVIEKLGCHLPGRQTNFQHWIVFNARKQEFQIVYGIQVEQLRNLIHVDLNRPCEASKIARGHLINAFSMCDAEGTRARHVDLHSFHGCFTPEFYPRRFALKDSIYHQRLDILAALIAHITARYQTCLPPVTYCEFSVSVNDISRAWVLDVLRSVQFYDQETIQTNKKNSELSSYKACEELSSFAQVVFNNHFPHLHVTFMGPLDPNGKNVKPSLPVVTYKFLAGFDRQNIKSPFPVDQDEALHLLYVRPQKAILKMMKEIEKSECNQLSATSPVYENDKAKAFDPCLEQLKGLKCLFTETKWIHKWVVGLDLFGDELGYPYCPFVAHEFIQFINEQTEKNKYFGVRIHCGENVKFATDDSPAYRLFVAHMYIVFRCLLFLQQKLKCGIRIGHGIAFDHILSADLKSAMYRKSSVLMAEMRNDAYYLFEKIAFEVNLTSNEYLLGQNLRQGNYTQILSLKALFKMGARIILATDDDGIWPIDQCPSIHPGHHSLAAEYCRAISTSLIDSEENLEKMLQTMEQVCFSDMRNAQQQSLIENRSSDGTHRMNTIIIHPDIIRLIREDYKLRRDQDFKSDFENFEKYKLNNAGTAREVQWTDQFSKMRVAFVCICANREEGNKEKLRKEYEQVFDNQERPEYEFNFIYDLWQDIYKNFVVCESGGKPELKLLSDPNKKKYFIRSVESDPEESLKFLEEIAWSSEEINIRAYATEIDYEKAKSGFETWVAANKTKLESAKGTLHLFTNTNKYTYAYSVSNGTITFRLNPAASKREKKEENFIYILCEHASAATAAVYIISEQLSEFTRNPAEPPNPALFASNGNEVQLGNTITGSTTLDTTTAATPSPPEAFTMQPEKSASNNDSTHENNKRSHQSEDVENISKKVKPN